MCHHDSSKWAGHCWFSRFLGSCTVRFYSWQDSSKETVAGSPEAGRIRAPTHQPLMPISLETHVFSRKQTWNHQSKKYGIESLPLHRTPDLAATFVFSNLRVQYWGEQMSGPHFNWCLQPTGSIPQLDGGCFESFNLRNFSLDGLV